MTVEQSILSDIKELPENLKLKVAKYVSKLKSSYSLESGFKDKPPKRVFGRSKGKYVLSDDFDAPLDDFKDYI